MINSNIVLYTGTSWNTIWPNLRDMSVPLRTMENVTVISVFRTQEQNEIYSMIYEYYLTDKIDKITLIDYTWHRNDNFFDVLL